MQVTSIEQTSNQYGTSKKCQLDNGQVLFVSDKDDMFSTVAVGTAIEDADVEKKTSQKGSEYYVPVRKKGGAGGYAKKQADIAQSQAAKAQSIKEAQDRTAMMWAKNNAAELVAQHPAFKDLDAVGVEAEVSRLAGSILNDDLIPF